MYRLSLRTSNVLCRITNPKYVVLISRFELHSPVRQLHLFFAKLND